MLKGKQKRFLRSMAHSLRPVFQIGKDGLTDTLVSEIDAYIKKHELMKVHVLRNCLFETEELCEMFEEEGFEVVQSIGNMIVIYKKNHEKPVIELP